MPVNDDFKHCRMMDIIADEREKRQTNEFPISYDIERAITVRKLYFKDLIYIDEGRIQYVHARIP